MKYGFLSVIVLLVSAAVTATAAEALPNPVDVGVKHASDAVERGTLPVEPTKKVPSASFKTLARTALMQPQRQIHRSER